MYNVLSLEWQPPLLEANAHVHSWNSIPGDKSFLWITLLPRGYRTPRVGLSYLKSDVSLSSRLGRFALSSRFSGSERYLPRLSLSHKDCDLGGYLVARSGKIVGIR